MRKYDDEFKQQTLKKVFDGQSAASVSRESGVAENLIHKWKRAALENGANNVPANELRENIVLKKRMKQLEEENDVLKKAAIIFGRGS